MNDTFQAVIAYRMNKAEERMKLLEEVVRQASKDVAQIMQDMKDWKVSTVIGEVVRTEAPDPIDISLMNTATVRKTDVVKQRWSEWKRLTLEGKTPCQIARIFKCHHTAVTNAMKRNFEPAWLQKGKRT